MVSVNGSLPAAQPSFSPEALGLYVPAAPSANADGQEDQVASARTYYRRDIHGDYAAFRRSPDYYKYKDEFYAAVEFLSDFCRQRSMADAEQIAGRLRKLYYHRFPRPVLGPLNLPALVIEHVFHEDEPGGKFEGYKCLIDSQGKQSLDHICDLIRNPRIPVDKKEAAMRNLSMGLNVCAAGVVSNLTSAEGELAMSSEGIRAEIWRIKHKIAEQVIKQAAYETLYSHPDISASHYRGNEIHMVNAGWNHIADTIGLPQRTDPYTESYANRKFFETCREKISLAITPDRLAAVIAEEILAMFAGLFAEQGWASSGDWSGVVNVVFENILQHVQEYYRLAPADLRLAAFVRLDDSGTGYYMRGDATLIARDILRIMYAEGLITKDSAPVNQGQWTGSDGTQHALLTFGSSLAWHAEQPGTSTGASNPTLKTDAEQLTLHWTLETDAEQLTLHDLYMWWEAVGRSPEVLTRVFPAPSFSAVLRQAVDGGTLAGIDDIPSDWLTDFESLLMMLPHMADRTVHRCVQANILFLDKLSKEECGKLIDLAAGKSTDALRLASLHYKNPWALLGQPRDEHRDGGFPTRLHYWMATDNGAAIDALLPTPGLTRTWHDRGGFDDMDVFKTLRWREAQPLLNIAMAAGNAKSTGAWCRLVLLPEVINRVGKHLSELIAAKDAHGNSALGAALFHGHAKAIEAAYDLYTNPGLVWKIGEQTREILIAPYAGVPGLFHAMAKGHSESVQCYHAMVVAPAVFPYAEFKTSDLVRAAAQSTRIFGLKGTWTTGLVEAMKYGHANCVRAWHVMVADPLLLPNVAEALPGLVTDTTRDGKGCLAVALEYDRTDAILEFHELLANPSITPHIKCVLQNLVRNDTPQALGVALEKGYADSIKALHGFLVDDAIRPFIVGDMRKLLAAPGRDKKQGLLWAVRNNHAAAIDAYGDMLADPELLPLVKHDLSRWLRRVLTDLRNLSDPAGGGKLLPAMRESRSAGLTAFRRLLEHQEIAVHLDEGTRKKAQCLEMDETAAIVEIAPAATTTTTMTTITATTATADAADNPRTALAVFTPKPSLRSFIAAVALRFLRIRVNG